MSPAQQRGLALWTALLSPVVCLRFLPVPRLVAVLALLVMPGLLLAFSPVVSSRAEHDLYLRSDGLPRASYR